MGGWSKLATIREVVVGCSAVDAGVTVWDLNSGAVLSHLRSCAAPRNALACVGFHFLAAAQVHKPCGSAGGGAIFFWAWHKVRASCTVHLCCHELSFYSTQQMMVEHFGYVLVLWK